MTHTHLQEYQNLYTKIGYPFLSKVLKKGDNRYFEITLLFEEKTGTFETTYSYTDSENTPQTFNISAHDTFEMKKNNITQKAFVQAIEAWFVSISTIPSLQEKLKISFIKSDIFLAQTYYVDSNSGDMCVTNQTNFVEATQAPCLPSMEELLRNITSPNP
jgi:hypothetical protein